MALAEYYNLFDATKQEEEILFLADRALQSRELNEIQSILNAKIAGLGRALFKEGDVVVGCDIVPDADTGVTTVEEGLVYLRGAVRPVTAATLTIPIAGTVAIGVRYIETIATELEDPSLRDPAIGTRNFQEPGAARRVYRLVWGWQSTAGQSDGGTGLFHAIYTVVNGTIQNKTTPPSMDAVNAALAQYDRDSTGGYYVVAGLGTTYLATDAAAQEYVLSLAEGRANVNGFKIWRIQAERLRYPIDPDLREVQSEPHVFSGSGSMRIALNKAPIAVVRDVKVTAEKTVSVVHGAFTGCIDTLPDETVVSVVSVAQGATTYTAGTSYTVSGEEIDWSLGGPEPAPYSTYTVTYRYIISATPTEIDDTGFTVANVVTGSTLYVNYAWKMPRLDLLCIDQSGVVSRVKGVARIRNPDLPPTPSGSLALAKISHTWGTDVPPAVTNIGIAAIPVNEVQAMRDSIGELYAMLADTALRVDSGLREAAAKKGVFTDPFTGEGMRDVGTAQTAAIVGTALTLPIGMTGIYTTDKGYVTLDYRLAPCLEQTLRTGSMKINPYMAFDPIPANFTLNPSVDAYSVSDTVYTSDGTTSFINEGHYVPTFPGLTAVWSKSSSSDQVVGSSTRSAQYMRSLNVSFTASGFDPGEALDWLRFDGVDVSPTPKPQANGQGLITGTFTIPPNTPVGTKRVEIRGVQGSYGTTSYTGSYTITTTTRRVSTTVTTFWHDPLAQTFALAEARTLHGLDLIFTARGDLSNPVIVQIRDVVAGVPGRTVLTEGRIAASDIVLGGGYTRILFDPLLVEANTEYAIVVMTDDAAHAVAIAELGKTTPDGHWVTAQPYQIGVLLSSSNASTWTVHNDKDLTFRLLAAEYPTTDKVVTLGKYTVNAISDIVAMAGVELPAVDTDVVFTITDAAGEVHQITAGSALNLTDTITGEVTLAARLTGSGSLSPILYPTAQLLTGSLSITADYIGRAFLAATTFGATVILDTYLPGTSTVKVYVETTAVGTWTQVPFSAGVPLDNGWVEQTFKASALAGVGTAKTTRVRIVLTGSPSARPFVRNLRALAL